MPTFEYNAIRTETQEDVRERTEKSFVGGVIVAKSRKDAKAKLRQHGLKATMLSQTKGVMALIKWFEADIR